MTNAYPLSGLSEAVGGEIRRWRERRKWSVEDLAARCTAVGAPHLTTAALYALESGRKEPGTDRRRRLVSVDELLVLAHVLGTKPQVLLASADLPDDEPYSVTPSFTTTAGAVRRWFEGEGQLDEWVAVGPHGTERLSRGMDGLDDRIREVLANNPDGLLELIRKSLDAPIGGARAGDPQGDAE